MATTLDSSLAFASDAWSSCLAPPHAATLVLRSRPLFVRLSTVLAPNLFWATEISTNDNFKGSDLAKVLGVERQLGEMYNGAGAEKAQKGRVPDEQLVANKMVKRRTSLKLTSFVKKINRFFQVAVRKRYSDPHWYRAKIVSVVRRYNGKRKAHVTYVRVFLVDYGRYYADIPAAHNVRDLPKLVQVRPKPLAFSISLAGMRPVSLDIDYSIGMKTLTEVVAQKWSSTAMQLVKVTEH
jgi:hypothetical protein